MNRPLSENCRALDVGFDVRLISPISGVEQFPRTHGESDIISGLSSHVETVVLLSEGEVNSKKGRVEFLLKNMDKPLDTKGQA